MEADELGIEAAVEQLRREFDLPEEDIEYLNSLGFPWETVKENNVMRLVLHDYPVPDGYNHPRVSLYLRIERAYPDTEIDMVYFQPALSRTDGKSIKALSDDNFDGKVWQRWSRHRSKVNPWCIGIDRVETHMVLVKDWLEREFRRIP